MAPRRHKDDDPLTRAIAPPPNETPTERELRMAAEQEAKRVSDAIDDELNRQRIAEKKSPRPVKILLLGASTLISALLLLYNPPCPPPAGQSESGKSTTLKNFQLMHSPKVRTALLADHMALVHLECARLSMQRRPHGALSSNSTSSSPSMLSSILYQQPTQHPTPPHHPHLHQACMPLRHYHQSLYSPTGTTPKEYPPLTPDHLKLKMRLAPLIQVEAALIRKLLPLDQVEDLTRSNLTSFPFHQEISVNSSAGWKTAFNRLLRNGRDSCDSMDLINWSDPDDPGVILHACSDDMIKLWADPTIRKLMEVEKMRPEEMAGFFLDALHRVTSPKYIPTDDDILRARLKTVGVSEHRFQVKTGHLGSSMSSDWRVFDVGGQRSLVTAWVPYFDDMNAIIFLAPISCFDQVLQEDPNVNRLADSFLLWKSIASSPLLKKTDLVLFLNKCDILRTKLESGIRLGDYITSYGDRPNDFESASTCQFDFDFRLIVRDDDTLPSTDLRKKFAGLMKEHAGDRPFYCHFTSVTDTQSTALILQNGKYRS
ncbi:guanine nucleotide binding protein, alpha subunit [Boletus reticuloceps]|uniref:Guanine nucleotide binding protein, alpha subunit n=1 Tax=Boletus reticuloceps TaxID=495285 RepID=A0A8I2YUX0_9AGAM|nr:guanine nucleotide binding protein, alpha subunit [Boletus reticuloceps]